MLWMTTHATERSHFLNRCFIPGLLAFRILVKSDPQTPIGFDPLQSNTTLNNIARLESYSHGETGDQILYCLLLSGLDFFFGGSISCLLTPSAFPLTLFWSLP